MSKTKFAIGALMGAALSYWAMNKYSAHKDELISFVTDKFEQMPKINKQKMEQAFKDDTAKLQQALDTDNSAEIDTNFDDIKLDADKIQLDK
ncbi:MAG: hypothetical protein J6584_06470 [Lactobacillus sp.]|jgi:hypothetical protein|uniref:Uncharacterized protein n=1 Tax=Bombilactobacillus bombi TaxID=1303590 RepID=A0A347SQB0_9LACO|nr:hypothetical protein [Bombilactobacillus bombi]MCO6541429.1 hypothetical protein [Lactobacillus sp.]AXX64219.1 hypothetical protein DS830_01275 [Bombilactobacillus bombi]MCO6543591.1 hypothetical protein [Lactobacillus sp.]RHW44148.1 hypothetical protein DS832_09260 [Bombilactobacillus bombi]RHW51777.1 hypothetical protein DS831_00100 [Bombilactobacillus bombi]